MPIKETKLSDVDVVLYALYLLGGWQERVHTEDIALKSYELTPTKFSWVKYPQYPDSMAVWYALGDAKKDRYGALVVGGSERKKGSGKDKFGGWRLSEKGVIWIKDNINRIELSLKGNVSPENRLLVDRRIKALMNSKAFNNYLVKGEKAIISHAEFAESLTCTVNTKPEVLYERLEQLYSSANILNQYEVKQYIDFCRNRFTKQIKGV